MTHMLGHDEDPGCTKCVIDNGMSIYFARLYGRRIADRTLRAIDKAAPLLYEELMVNVFAPLATAFRAKVKTGSEQHTRLMAQIDRECYRADTFLAWAQTDEILSDTVARQTAKIFEWAKDNQTFYTAFADEIEKG